MAETPPQEPAVPVIEELEAEEFKQANRDLNLNRLALDFAARRDMEIKFSPEDTQKKIAAGTPIFDLDTVLEENKSWTGMSAEEYRKVAEGQGFSLQDMFNRVAQQGQPVREVMGHYKANNFIATMKPEERKARKRGTTIHLEGLKRVAKGEKDVTKAEQKRILGELQKPTKKQWRMIYEDTEEGVAENMVAQPGQAGYVPLEYQAEILSNPDKAQDPERARMIDGILVEAAGTGSTVGLMRDVFAEEKFAESVDKVASYDTQKIMAREGDAANEEEVFNRMRQKAIREFALYRTVNKFVPPMFLSWSEVDPTGTLSNISEDAGWLEQAREKGSKVRVELLGVDKEGIPVFRATSPYIHIAEMLDVAQAAGTGAIERALKGPEGESIMDAISIGSLEGIEQRRDAMKALLSTEAARTSDTAAIALGSAGLAIAILTPDLLMGAAGVTRATNKIAKATKEIVSFRKVAPELIESLGDGARGLARGEDALVRAQEAVASGNFDEAIEIIEQAQGDFKASERAQSAARRVAGGVMDTVDTLDGDIARRIAKEVPEATLTEGKRVASNIPGGFGFRGENIHPSVRRLDFRGESTTQFVPYPEFFNTSQQLEGLKDAIRILKDGAVAEAFVAPTYINAVQPFIGKLDDVLSKARVSRFKTDLDPDDAQSIIDLYHYLWGYDSVLLLRNSPGEWTTEIKRLMQNLPFDDAGKKSEAIDDMAEAFTKAISDAAEAGMVAARKMDEGDIQRAIVGGIRAVRANSESRAASMAFVREQVGQQIGSKTDPILVAVTEKYKEIGRGSLSAEALSFRDEIEAAYPALKGDAATKIVRLIDKEAKKFAKKTDRTVGDYYQERFAGIERAAKEVQFKPLDEGLVEISSKAIRDTGEGGGLVFKIEDGTLAIHSVELPEALRGQGLGTDLYLQAMQHAKEQGLRFASDIGPSLDATGVYERLIQRGVPLVVEPVSLDEGARAIRYVMSAEDLAKFDPTATLRAGTDADALVVQMLENGQAIIRAMDDSATVEDFVRAIGRISRRDLSERQMSSLVAWLATKGVAVTAKGAHFVADDPATIEKAEAVFARAFQEYVASGRADKPEVIGAFDQVKDWVAETYSALKGAETDGAALAISADLRRTLDDLLQTEAPERVGMPNIVKVVKDEILGPVKKGLKVNIVDELVRETHRLGKPVSRDDLIKQLDEANKAHSEGRFQDAVIELPVAVQMAGWIGPKKGKKVLTINELADIQLGLENAKRFETHAAPKLAIKSRSEAITELTPSEIVDQYIKGSKAGGVMQFARNIYIGGDAFDDMRHLPPEIRDRIMAGARRTQQAIGDTVTLIAEGDSQNLIKYLSGDPSIQFKFGGRSAMSAGHDSVGSVLKNANKYFTSIAEEDLAILVPYIEKIRIRGKVADVVAEMDAEDVAKLEGILDDVIRGPMSSRFVRDVFESAELSKTRRIEPKMVAQPVKTTAELDKDEAAGLLETLMYYSGVTTRDKKLWVREGKSAETFERLYRDVTGLFPDERVANRTAVLVAGHGMADAAKHEWVKLGIAVDEGTATAYKKWISGEAISPEQVVQVKQAFQVMGFSPNYVEGMDLYGVKMYVPKAARNRLSLALSQALDPEISAGIFKGDLIEQLGSGTKAAATNSQLSFAWTYRYIKTRMVRGHFVLKSRYFWMNTFDTFNQLALEAGFRAAMVHTSRMIWQNVLSNPLGQAVLLTAQKAGAEGAPEAVRRVLQEAGDKSAKLMGTLTRASKWHIEVNPILEGAGGFVILGGRPYARTKIRQIALEAGIFASFDTKQLGIKIRKVGDMFLSEAQRKGDLTAKGKELLRDIGKISEDIAEAWAERERIGCMVTLMEMGIEPRTAAKITIKALYDYAGSMSKWDRNFLINIFFPFWAFQKNANRQVLDAVFSPWGAYRLGVMRRAYTKGTEYISHIIYDRMVDDFGIRTEALPPDLKNDYDLFKNALADKYDGLENVPPDVRQDVKLWLSGATFLWTRGQLIEARADDIDRRKEFLQLAPGTFRLADMSTYYIPRPRVSGRPTFLRDRPGVDIPYVPEDWAELPEPGNPTKVLRRTTKEWIDLFRQDNPDVPYTTLFMPEPVYDAAFKHMANLTATMVLMAYEVKNMGPEFFSDADDGFDIVSPYTPLNEVLNPARAPIMGDILTSFGVNQAAHPKKIASGLVSLAERVGLDILSVDSRKDPFLIVPEGGEAWEPVPQEGIPVGTKQNHYMMPGVHQLIFANSPLGEINDIMLKIEKSPVEEAAALQGELLRLCRVITGLDQRETIPKRTTAAALYEAADEPGAQRVKKKLKGK